MKLFTYKKKIINLNLKKFNLVKILFMINFNLKIMEKLKKIFIY